MKTKVSVIIPTYNRRTLLKKAIDSVLSQSFQDFELIVVDDGSEDDTTELIAAYGKRITAIRQENRGPSAARNRGMEASRAELFAFLDSDDWWDKDKLMIQMAAMEKHPSYLISHTREIWYRRGKLLNQKKKHKKYHGYIFPDCLPLCAVSLSTVIARKKLFSDVGLFDEELPCCEDYDFWLRSSIKLPFLLVDKPLTLKDGGRQDQLSYIYRVGMDKYRIQSLAKILGTRGLLSSEQRKLALRELEKKCRIYGNGCLKHGKVAEGNYYLDLPNKVPNIS